MKKEKKTFSDEKIQILFKTSLHDFYLVASETKLYGCYLDLQKKIPLVDLKNEKVKKNKILQMTMIQLTQYLQKKRTQFTIPLAIEGTSFQKKVWTALLKISYGQTKSYKDIATQIKSKAMRAVGSANRKNHFCVIIPCHRVIAHDGGLGGYAGGLPMKIKLLHLEK